jgi:hypothetical protein
MWRKLMNEKSILSNFMKFFSIKSKSYGGAKLSASDAISLQNAYIAAVKCVSSDNSLPYAEIFKQLYSHKEEVFAATIYYLRKIADNNPDIAPNIVSALQNFVALKTNKAPERKQQIQQLIEDIEKTLR